ncbi:sulfatase-like hydrolase/transferase [bacterium]|nr:sulfatase-like hydrolase/transferase [bacterium]
MQRIVFALSFAVLALIRNWYMLASTQNFHYPTFRPTWIALVNLLLNHFCLTFLVWCLLTLAARSKSRWPSFVLYWVLIVALIPAFLFVRHDTNLSVNHPILSFSHWAGLLTQTGVWAAFALAAASAFWASLRKPERFMTLTRALASLILPFAAFHFVRLAYLVASVPTLPHSGDLGIHGTTTGRTVVVVFDEFDYATFLEARKKGMDFPTFEKLEKDGLSAAEAYSPAIHTHAAMPSYFFGRRITRFCRLPNDDMLLRFEGDTEDSFWSQEPTLVSDVYSMGISTSLVGWYHPYCQIMGRHIKTCLTNRSPFFQSTQLVTPRRMLANWGQAFNPFALRLPSHLRRYELVMEQAEAALRATDSSFAFIHLPVPHLPAIYDLKTKSLVTDYGNSEEEQHEGYLANLVLADMTLARLMEIEKETWGEDTTWVVTADHSIHAWRWEEKDYPEEKIDRRIPFWVLAGKDPKGLDYNKPFNTILLKDLILELLADRQPSLRKVAGFLDKNLPSKKDLMPTQPVDTCPSRQPRK